MRQENLIFHEPVIVITAEDSTDNRVKVLELGAMDIIAKPFEPDVVKSRVKNIIESGRYRRSLESGLHIRRIRMFTKILLEEVARNYQEYQLDAHKIRLITESSSMHDIGKFVKTIPN